MINEDQLSKTLRNIADRIDNKDVKNLEEVVRILISEKTKQSDIITTVKTCARCKKDHENLSFYTFKYTPKDTPYTHWSICPKTQEPILLYIKEI